jgi:hypothetical protein
LFGHTDSTAMLQNIRLENVDIIGNKNVGGLVGWNDGQIRGCSINGNVKGEGGDGVTGGLAGVNRGVIESSHSTGTVVGVFQVGGLVGNNTNTGTIENSGSIYNSYASGSVTGSSHSVGGLVGYNKGNVSNCYATGHVTGTNNIIGGLVGKLEGGVITNSYYDSETSGRNDTGKGEPKTTAEMKTLTTYENWDITGQDGFYPKLGWEVNWSANTWYMGTPPAPDNTSGGFGFFDFEFPPGLALLSQNGSGLTTITGQGNAPITPGIIASGNWNDLNQAVAAYQAALVALENSITTLSPAELALIEVELAIARAAILAMEARLLAAEGLPYNLAALQAAYAAAVAAFNANQSFLSTDQQAAANQLLTAIADVIAALQ